MKRLFLFLSALPLLWQGIPVLPASAKTADNIIYGCDKELAVFFTHALVAYPELGFKKGNGMRDAYDTDYITPDEFRAVLTSLYERGYALADLRSTYSVAGGRAVRRAFPFPADKKPLVLLFDDINYYTKKMNSGMNDRLALDSAGNICSFTAGACPQVRYDNEVVTVLESFIADRPDFSPTGARGVLCLTGFDGVLGYRTQSGSPNAESERVKAAALVAALKSRGWSFACHSYGHYHMKSLSLKRFAEDTDKWLCEVAPIVGNTDIYVYPYGEWEISDRGGVSEKHRCLRERGFNLFCGVGVNEYYRGTADGALLLDRKPVDGYSLRHRQKEYAPYFDCSAVYDSRRPAFSAA